jgi:hypothetical protein
MNIDIKAARKETLAQADTGRRFVVQLDEDAYKKGSESPWHVWDTYGWRVHASGLTRPEAQKAANTAERQHPRR